MNISELIAAKKAAIAGAPQPATAAPPADPDLDAAIDRIDPPGKQATREAAKKATRALILTDAPVPKSPPPSSPPCEAEPRSLGSHRGEMIDMTPPGASQAVSDWHQAAIQPETSLCLVRDKNDPERAWIAVQMDGNRAPILLMSLPLFDATADPF